MMFHPALDGRMDEAQSSYVFWGVLQGAVRNSRMRRCPVHSIRCMVCTKIRLCQWGDRSDTQQLFREDGA